MSLSIQQAAASTRSLERPHIFRTRAEIRLGDPIFSGAYKAAEATAAIRSFTLKDTVLDADCALLLQGNAIIDDTRYFVPSDYEPVIAPDKLIEVSDAADFIIGYNRTHSFYSHWLTQCLPAIDWGLRQPRLRQAALVMPPLAQWQEEMLAALGHQAPRLTVQAGRFYRLPNAEYAEFLAGKASFGVSHCIYLTARRLLDAIPDTNNSASILFVPNVNPYYGPLTNQRELIEFLQQQGVVIAPDNLPLVTRLNLFRHAKAVIGPHGPGLSDVLFCRPGTVLWEWTPRHLQNAAVARQAQTAQVDYWADVFDAAPSGGPPGAWSVDLNVVKGRLAEIAQRPTWLSGVGPSLAYNERALPLDEIMLAFESLGDNCEFGLVQRRAGVDPLGLLRFAGTSLERLLKALGNEFAGVGDIENVHVFPAGDAPDREMMVHESSLGSNYHTFINESEVDAEKFRRQQARQLSFLRRKILEDLRTGEKIWVWRQWQQIDVESLAPLLECLRRYGPNRLLWVTPADADHPPGTIAPITSDFVRGYVKYLAPYHAAVESDATSWFDVCEAAYSYFQRDAHKVPNAPAEPEPLAERMAALHFVGQTVTAGWLSAPNVPRELLDRFCSLRSDDLVKIRRQLGPGAAPRAHRGETGLPDLRTPSVVSDQLRSGFIGLGDSRYGQCPFHHTCDDCSRHPEQTGVIPSSTEPLPSTPWWQRTLEAARLEPVSSCRMLERLLQTDQIIVWQSSGGNSEAEVRALAVELQTRGCNHLLWVRVADQDHPTGWIESAGQGLLKGYVSGFATSPETVDARGWHALCQNAVRFVDFLQSAATWMTTPQGTTLPGGLGPATLPPLSLVESAIELDYVESAQAKVSTGSVQLDNVCWDDRYRKAFTGEASSIDVRSALLHDVVLTADRQMLLQNGRKIAGTDLWHSEAPPPHFTSDHLVSPATNKVVVLGTHFQEQVYYHWMLQCLPSLHGGVEKLGAGNCALGLPTLTPWQKETLELLGIGAEEQVPIERSRAYYLPRVYFSEYLTGVGAFRLLPNVMRTFEALSAGVPMAADGPEKIYVARTDSARRIVTNEADVQALMEAHGFRIIVPGMLPIKEQVHLFRNARFVVGAHGGGLTNYVFCRPETKVLELVMSNYPNTCMKFLAQVRRLEYHAEAFVGSDDTWEHDRRWTIDLVRLRGRLRALGA